MSSISAQNGPPLSYPRLRLGVGLLVFSAVWFFFPLETWVTAFAEWVQTRQIQGPIAFGILYVLASLLLVPSTLMTLAAGSIWGFWWGTALLHFVSVIADVLMFGLARTGYLPLAARRQGSIRDQALEKDGIRIAVLLRWMPIIPTNVLNYVLGTTSLSTRDYVLSTVFGTIPNTLVVVYIGSMATDASRASVHDNPWFLALGAALATIATLGLMNYARRALQLEHAKTLSTHDEWQVVDSVADLPASLRSCHLPPMLDLSYLQAASAADPHDSWVYGIKSRNGVPVFFVPIHSFEMRAAEHVRGNWQDPGWLARLRLQAILIVLRCFNTRVAILGNGFASGVPAYWSAPEIDPEQAP